MAPAGSHGAKSEQERRAEEGSGGAVLLLISLLVMWALVSLGQVKQQDWGRRGLVLDQTQNNLGHRSPKVSKAWAQALTSTLPWSDIWSSGRPPGFS